MLVSAVKAPSELNSPAPPQNILCVYFPKGVLLISMALTADAIIGNLQEKALRNSPNASNLEMIFYSYSIGKGGTLENTIGC